MYYGNKIIATAGEIKIDSHSFQKGKALKIFCFYCDYKCLDSSTTIIKQEATKSLHKAARFDRWIDLPRCKVQLKAVMLAPDEILTKLQAARQERCCISLSIEGMITTPNF